MTTKWLLVLSGICACNTGCGLYQTGIRTVGHEFARVKNELADCVRNKLAAKEAWNQLAQASPPCTYSKDYERGFKDGFCDYVESGGSGNPPVMPPYHYLKTRHESASGQAAVQDYFAGFQHGSAVARESGFRNYVTVSTSGAALLTSDTHGPPSSALAPSPAVGSTPTKDAQTLPAPTTPASKEGKDPKAEPEPKEPAKLPESPTKSDLPKKSGDE